MYALVDCNSFYASCERLFRPDLDHVPIVVLSNNDGCNVAMCDLAKKLGIPMGEPYFKLKPQIEKHNVKVFSSNYTLYGDISKRVMTVLDGLAPSMEVYSIDEAFLDFSGMNHFNLEELGRQIRQSVWQSVGIPTCVGIGPTKALAKAANRVAKKHKERTGGVWVLDSQEKIDKCLRWLDIEDVWGIGRRHGARLRAQGVAKASDFILLQEKFVKDQMSIVGLRLQKELKGISCLPLELVVPKKKSICTSRSFGKMLSELSQVEAAVTAYASRCASKLRRHGLCASSLVVFLHTNPFRPDDPQRSVHAKHVFGSPTSYSHEIIGEALRMLRALWKDGYQYKKAGVIVMDNVPENQVQGNLFDLVDREKAGRSMKALDAANGKYGADVVGFGATCMGYEWRLRREMLSPCYTTRWEDLVGC